MSWIKTIGYEASDSKLRRIYDRIKGPNNTIDNVLSIHSLRPHSLEGHMTLYKSVLHNSNNQLPKWYLEALGVYVSHLNNCFYCVTHHFEGFKRLINDPNKAQEFWTAMKQDQLNKYFDMSYFEGVKYAKKLTLALEKVTQDDVEKLKAVGLSDGEILEINQVTSYFNYVNRTVIGLGVHTKGDIIGLSPNESDDPSNWTHK